MSTAVKVKNFADAFTSEIRPNNNFGDKARLYVHATAGSIRRGWLFFNRPFPIGAMIFSAKLQVYPGEAWGTSTTLTAQRAAAKWGVNRITHTNQPGVVGSTAVLTKGSSAAGELWEIDITALMQEVANGGAWFGLRLITNRASASWIHSAQSSKPGKRPQVVIEYGIKPDAPDNLNPNGGRAVSMSHPILTWDFNQVTGEEQISACRVKINTTADMSTPAFDSGWVNVSTNQLDLSTTAYAGIANGATAFWQVFARDAQGLESVGSEVASFTRLNKGTLSLSSPSGSTFTDHIPVVAWSLSGATQAAYQVFVAEATNPNAWTWDSGKITGSATSVGIPEGVLSVYNNWTYVFGVRVWDTALRAGTPGAPAYYEAITSAMSYGSGATTGISGLGVASHAYLPSLTLSWTRATAPDYYMILRSFNDTSYHVLDYVSAAEASAGGTNYTYVDYRAKPYTTTYYKVAAVVGGVLSAASGAVSGQSRRLAPFLMREDGSDVICFLNPQRQRSFLDDQVLMTRRSGPPVLVTQQLGYMSGSVAGRLASDVLPGVTAEMMRDSFESIRKDAGTPVIIITANETIRGVAFNMQYDVLTDASGVTYQASFDWAEVPK